MKRLIVITGLFTLIVFSGLAQGALTARDFVSRCQGAVMYSEVNVVSLDYETGYCMGTFFGISSALNGTKFCLPEGVDIKQTANVFLKYMDNHPEKLHMSGATLIYESLISSFPCE